MPQSPPVEVPERELPPFPPEPAYEQPEAPATRLVRLRRRLASSNNALARALADLLSSDRIDDDTWDDFETTLITSDLGVGPTTDLVAALRQDLRIEGISDPAQAKSVLRRELVKLVNPDMDRGLNLGHAPGRPAVVVVVGVNGTGKTTLMDDMRWTFIPAQRLLGYSINTTDEAELDEVGAVLKNAAQIVDRLLQFLVACVDG